MDVREKTASEKRLIDANALLDEFLKQYTKRERDGNLVFAACEIKQDFADMISNFPTVDAVEVVRCKDCKHRYSDSWCEYVDDDDNFYCAKGELKDGDER